MFASLAFNVVLLPKLNIFVLVAVTDAIIRTYNIPTTGFILECFNFCYFKKPPFFLRKAMP